MKHATKHRYDAVGNRTVVGAKVSGSSHHPQRRRETVARKNTLKIFFG